MDDVFSLRYILNVSFLRLGKVNFSILFLMCTILLYYISRQNLLWGLMLFFSIGCMDIYNNKNQRQLLICFTLIMIASQFKC